MYNYYTMATSFGHHLSFAPILIINDILYFLYSNYSIRMTVDINQLSIEVISYVLMSYSFVI